MLSYHNDPAIKEKYVERIKAHIKADELVRGIGFENGRGCAIGCTLDRYNHKGFEDELGIPEWLARLLDFLHENTSDEIWPTFALDFLEAVQIGKDLDLLRPKINLFILNLNLQVVQELKIDADLKMEVIAAIEQCIDLHTAWDEVKRPDYWFSAAKCAAESAAWCAAECAARSARSAESAWSTAESAAWCAAECAARSAWCAAEFAESADWSAESAAWCAARSARSAWCAAESAAWCAAKSDECAARSAESAWSTQVDIIAAELLRLLKI